MFAAIVNWFNKRQENKRKTRFNCGFACAMNSIMSGEETRASLEDKTAMSRSMGDYDDFDRGVDAFLSQSAKIDAIVKEAV